MLEFTSVPSRSKMISLIFIGIYITRDGEFVSMKLGRATPRDRGALKDKTEKF
jgi:hypothetical protein